MIFQLRSSIFTNMSRELLGQIGRKLIEVRNSHGEGVDIYFHPLETVGRIGVSSVELQTTGIYAGLSKVSLDLIGFNRNVNDESIRGVPQGWIEEGDIAEIIVRRGRRKLMIPMLMPDNCLVTLRPFDPSTHGKPLNLDNEQLLSILYANKMNANSHPLFYKKFITAF